MNSKQWTVFGILLAATLALVGLGFAAMSTNPPFIVPEWVPVLFFVAGGIVLFISIGYMVYAFINKDKSADYKGDISGSYSIIPILKKMHRQACNVANNVKKEGLIRIDMRPFDEITNPKTKVMKFMEYSFTATNDPKNAKTQMQNVLDLMESDFKKTKDILDIMPILNQAIMVVDASGGLKPKRESDRRYLNLKNQVDGYYDSYSHIINDRLDKLIQAHISCSEACSDLIYLEPLLKYFLPLMPTQIRLSMITEGIDNMNNKALRRVRVKIGECIREIEGS